MESEWHQEVVPSPWSGYSEGTVTQCWPSCRWHNQVGWWDWPQTTPWLLDGMSVECSIVLIHVDSGIQVHNPSTVYEAGVMWLSLFVCLFVCFCVSAAVSQWTGINEHFWMGAFECRRNDELLWVVWIILEILGSNGFWDCVVRGWMYGF